MLLLVTVTLLEVGSVQLVIAVEIPVSGVSEAYARLVDAYASCPNRHGGARKEVVGAVPRTATPNTESP